MTGPASALVKFFLTGVATLLPFIVTLFVVTWAVRIADAYIGPSSTFGLFVVRIAGTTNWLPGYIFGYLVVVALITLIGLLVNRATVSRIHHFIDRMFARIPLFGKLHMAVTQLVDLFGKKDQSGLERFGGVGYVRVGNIRMLVLLTSHEQFVLDNGQAHFLVFIPNTPIPATGFNALVPVEDFTALNIPVDELAKLLFSLGVLGPQVLKKPGVLAANDTDIEDLKIPILDTKNINRV